MAGTEDWEIADDDPEYVSVGVRGLVAASARLLAVNRGLAETDNREHLAFKKVMDVPALVRERLRIDEGGKRRKALVYAARARSLDALTPNFAGGAIRGQFVGNELSSDTEQTNPMLGIENLRRLTQMGPGGIGSDHAITAEMQALDPSTFGYLSAIEGPESARIGIDTRMSIGTKYGSDGRIYQVMRNRRTGKTEYVSPSDLLGKVVKIND